MRCRGKCSGVLIAEVTLSNEAFSGDSKLHKVQRHSWAHFPIRVVAS